MKVYEAARGLYPGNVVYFNNGGTKLVQAVVKERPSFREVSHVNYFGDIEHFVWVNIEVGCQTFTIGSHALSFTRRFNEDQIISALIGALQAIDSIKYYHCTIDEYAEIVKSITKKALANVETQTS